LGELRLPQNRSNMAEFTFEKEEPKKKSSKKKEEKKVEETTEKSE